MRNLPSLSIGAAAALFLLAGCQGGSGISPYGATASAPATAVPASCVRTCNSEYDSCIGRGGGAGASSSGEPLGPNYVCPDQLKACLRCCVP